MTTYTAEALDQALSSGDPDRIEAALETYASHPAGAQTTAIALAAKEDDRGGSRIYRAPGGAMVFGDTAEDQDAFFRS